MLKDFESINNKRLLLYKYFIYKPDRSMCISYLRDTCHLLFGFDEDTFNHTHEVGYNMNDGSIGLFRRDQDTSPYFEGIHITVGHSNMDILYLDNDNIIGKFLDQSGILKKVN